MDNNYGERRASLGQELAYRDAERRIAAMSSSSLYALSVMGCLITCGDV